MGDKPRTPNLVLRGIREERRQTRAEFAESLARKCYEIGENLVPSERYIARLEDGEIRFPNPVYRRALVELCGRPIHELGFSRPPADQVASAVRPPNIPAPGRVEIWRGYQPAKIPDLGGNSSPEKSEWPVWFGVKLAHLISLTERWQGAEMGDLQDILAQEISMCDNIAPPRNDPDYAAFIISRRQTLTTLAALPLAFAANLLSDDGRSISAARDSFLAQCAASITSCWYLLRGSDLDAVDHVLSGYLIPLEGIARQGTKHQRAAATLASQTHRVRGIVALHRGQLAMREYHCKQAYHYATVASDTGSQAAALISLASTYFYNSAPEQAAAVYERALALEAQLTPLQRSRVHAELSVVYGQLDRVNEAVRSAETAGETYPDDPKEDPSYLYAEFTPASLALERGLAYLALAGHHSKHSYQDQAFEIFTVIDRSSSPDIPDRIRFEIVNHLARASVLLNDAEAFDCYIRRGIEGAIQLGSRQRAKEARSAYLHASEKWPHERRLENVGELLRLTAADSRDAGEI